MLPGAATGTERARPKPQVRHTQGPAGLATRLEVEELGGLVIHLEFVCFGTLRTQYGRSLAISGLARGIRCQQKRPVMARARVSGRKRRSVMPPRVYKSEAALK